MKTEDYIPKSATIIQRSEHTISRTQISANALKVLYRLRKAGYSAYLVGGGVRDLLLGREPKDFDVATNAHPDEIKKCFSNGRLIGRRFRLVHVIFKDEIIEVSTFRAQCNQAYTVHFQTKNDMIIRDNVYGTFVEDAARRDFTVNALYYNIADFSVIDCHGGLYDLKHGILRIIGEPKQRYREDPVRLLRAARLAAKLGFRLEEASEKPLSELGYLLTNVSSARLYTEVEKLFLSGQALASFKLLRHYHLFQYLFPFTESCLSHENFETVNQFITLALTDTDQRSSANKPVTPSFLLAVFLWHPLQNRLQELRKKQRDSVTDHLLAMHELLAKQSHYISIPRRFAIAMREIWELQERMTKRKNKRTERILNHPRFRAAFDFLTLRFKIGEPIEESYYWWKVYYQGDSEQKTKLLKTIKKEHRKQTKQARKKQQMRTHD